MASAAFTINGSGSPVASGAGSVVTLALASTSGVISVAWTVVGFSDSAQAVPVITSGGSPSGATATFTLPSSVGSIGYSLIVQARINGGVDVQGQAVSAYAATGLVGVLNANGRLPFPVGEKFERNAVTGIANDMNAALASAGGGGGGTGNVTGGSSSVDKGIVRFSGTTGKTIQNTTGPKLEDDGRLSTITNPTGAQDAATKAYVDNIGATLVDATPPTGATTTMATIALADNTTYKIVVSVICRDAGSNMFTADHSQTWYRAAGGGATFQKANDPDQVGVITGITASASSLQASGNNILLKMIVGTTAVRYHADVYVRAISTPHA